MTQTIQIQNQSFILHSSGSLFWKEKQIVFIADVHLGKVSHFRKHGSAVPQETIKKNFDQLDNVIEYFNPKKICFLGDLFHSYVNSEWQLFEDWVTKTKSQCILIAGNHDIISPTKYENIGVTVGIELVIDDFLLTHHPEERKGLFNLCGHIHPGILLSGLGRQRLRLPCFFKSDSQMILPAFGKFTGIHVLEPSEKSEVYAITQNEVILVS
ncbi:ligase-associated DNA damage response endonuclease PdeM [Aquimarina algiphila]|uniref:ligase-associated DNA damage response endonuclease PdeM n=1 Tax=Aquimarina algiphila TaxID=2047982 RepID=UPI0024937859|nr:ligase-associated DNA damage response endonuclease PdeM [Aquimarina algiphila]